ncbi:MAG TPA: hypothetical protein VIJ96_11685 [Acidothermaceae bacterium]
MSEMRAAESKPYHISGSSLGLDARRGVWSLARYPWVVTLVLCGVVDVAGIRGVDLAAQDYRVWEFRAHGFTLWDVSWYGGHAALGYSVLFPAFGALVGAMPATSIAAICASWLFGTLVGPPRSWATTVARLWFAVLVVGSVVVGQGPFACALAFGLGSVLAVRRRRPWFAVLAALVTSLFSPLGAMFLLLVAAAWAPNVGWRRALPLFAATVGIGVSAASGDGGFFPFPITTLLGQLAIVVIGLLVSPRSNPAVRRGLVIFGVTCVALFFWPNPVGGNMARLAVVLIGPIAAHQLLRAHRARTLLLLTVPLLGFQLLPVMNSVANAAVDPSAHASYYQGMLGFLSAQNDVAQRIEIPLTRNHWEATYVAEKAPLARGWYRQVDIERNGALYKPLTATMYLQWLHSNAVDYVALPDVPLDYGGEAEAALLVHPPSYLHEVYVDPHWRIWRVNDPSPIATGAGRITAVGGDSFTLIARRAGPTLVRLRWSPYWQIDSGHACVSPAPDGWTNVTVAAPGSIQVTARLSLDSDHRCARPHSPAMPAAPPRVGRVLPTSRSAD